MSRNLLLLIPLVFLWIPVWSQSDRVEDFESWNKIELDHKINKDWALSFAEMYRLDNNASDYKSFISQIGISYDIKKWLTVASVGRFTLKPNSISAWRYSPVIRLNHRLKKLDLDLSYRFKPDFDWQERSSSTRIRNRFKIRHKKKKNLLRPALGIEFFHDDKKDGFELFRIRYLAALTFKISKKQSFEIGYFLQHAKNAKNPEDDYILALSYNYEI